MRESDMRVCHSWMGAIASNSRPGDRDIFLVPYSTFYII
jgi:hypothetical protein